MTTELLDSIEPMIAGIAAEFGRRHHIHGADSEDFIQEQRIWALENGAKVAEWLDPDLHSPEAGEKLLATALRNRCKRYGREVKAQALGYKADDLFEYKEAEVRHLLPLMFDPEKWLEPPQSEGRTTKAPSEGGNWIATLADISRAYADLELRDREILEVFHKEDWSNRLAAHHFELTEQTMSNHHARAVRRIVEMLNGERPRPERGPRDPWSGRRALTTAHARAITGGDYE